MKSLGIDYWNALVMGLLLIIFASPANAHLMPASKGTVSIKDNNIYVVQAVPASALTGFDTNKDTLIDQQELSRSYENLRQQIKSRVKFRSEDAQLLEADTWLVSAAGADHPEAPIDYIVALSAQRYSEPPRKLTMSTDLFGTKGDEKRLELSASYGDQSEVVMLSPERPTHRFFKSGFETLVTFIGTGIHHILSGVDHLLFLLTMIAVAMATRRLLAVITGFTIAHAITITAAGLGHITVPANVVEPLIALSIVLLAIDNLRSAKPQSFWFRFAIVFACGLLHGLGFASALSAFGLSKAHLVPSLIGFNLGVELGQITFVLACLACGWAGLWLVEKANLSLTANKTRKAITIIALVLGIIFLIQRMMANAAA
jgi:hydrogenase/urease accessory protein HupE